MNGTTPLPQCAHWDISPCTGEPIREEYPPVSLTADSVRLAVPEKRCGLTLFLALFDRCGNCGFPFSATGGGNPQFPLGRGGYKEKL